MRTTTAWLSIALLALSVLPALGCGGSGGAAAPPINFVYAPATGASPSVTTDLGAASDSSVAVIEIYVTDVFDVFGANFTLNFDTAVVAYTGFDVVGSHLASDGEAVEPVVDQTQPGEVTVGLTRLASTGIDFSGRQFLIRIRFLRKTTAGTTALAFASNDLLNSMTPPQPIPGVQWFGGTFQVN